MKNRLMQLAAGLALMAVLGKFYAVPLIAQVRAAVVKNIDERGRVPYMVQAQCNGGPGLTNQCAASFPAVSANRRFVVEYINGNLVVTHTQFSGAFLEVPSVGPSFIFLASHFELTNGDNDLYSVSMPVVLYYEAGQIPVAHIHAFPVGNNQAVGSVTLSGYLVDLTQ
jgi:hypothetical protein